MTNKVHQEFIDRMVKNKAFRLKMVTESHYWFFHYYFPEYVTYPTANFQKEILHFTEDDNIENLIITAFRGSSKSTLVTMSYVIWSILGRQQKKFALIIGHTQDMAQNHYQNIKYQFENNIRLKQDLGPFKTVGGPWGAQMLVLSDYKAKITTASVGQSVRGTRYNQMRPDLLVLDDIETIDSVKTQESRDGMYAWFTRDVQPAGDLDTKMVFIGTPLHCDSVMMRVKESIESGKMKGKFLRYPFFDENGVPLWREKFKSDEEIQKEKGKTASEIGWQHEYMLNLAIEEYQIINPKWMRKYQTIPERNHTNNYRFSVMSIDPGVKQKENSDPTAIVFADVFGWKETLKIYINPQIVNRKFRFEETINFVKKETEKYKESNMPIKVVIEDVGAQNYLIQQINDLGIETIGYSPVTADKRERLMGTTRYIQDGVVLFPERGIEILESQILGFGNEKHDDVMDAFTMLMHVVKEIDRSYQPYLVPKIELSERKTFTKEEQIKESDRVVIDEQETKRGRTPSRREAYEQQQKEAPAESAEKKWERDNFNKMMRSAMRRY